MIKKERKVEPLWVPYRYYGTVVGAAYGFMDRFNAYHKVIMGTACTSMCIQQVPALLITTGRQLNDME